MKNKERERATISPTTKKLINYKSLHYREMPRAALAIELQDAIKKLEGEAKKLPSLDTLERMISWARNHISPLDEEWTIGKMGVIEYQIHPLAVAKIFEMQVKGFEDKGKLTIRQAMWISRLCYLPISVDQLYFFAVMYSLAEQVGGDEMKSDFDTMLLEVIKDPVKAMYDTDQILTELAKDPNIKTAMDIILPILLEEAKNKDGGK